MNAVARPLPAPSDVAKNAIRRARGDVGSDKKSYQSVIDAWISRLRANQHIPAGDWLVYLILAGRGWGKSLAGAVETIKRSENCARIAVVAADFADGRDICVESETGIKALCPDLHWNRSLGEMTFPSGAKGKLYSAEDPEALRGPNNFFAWCDEMGKWRYQRQTWDMLMFTMRKGTAQTLITTTPRPSKLLAELMQRTTTVIVRGSSRENLENLSSAYVDNVIKRYENTRLGQQEIDGVLLEDTPGALWTRDLLDKYRVTNVPELKRIVVAVDPAATSGEDANETGIVVSGLDENNHSYVLDDKSLRATPIAWARQAIAAYHRFEADRLVYEANQGGEMVAQTLKQVDRAVPLRSVTASRGKRTRAEPISALYEQGKVHHVGMFAELEDQMCSWTPGDDSPDRLDALVWALTDLMKPARVQAGAQPDVLADWRG